MNFFTGGFFNPPTMKFLFILFSALLVLQSCTQPKKPIAKSEDYQRFLDESNIVLAKDDGTQFWESRLNENKKDETARLKVAALYATRFGSTGEIRYIQASDSLYQLVLEKTVLDKTEIYQALAANAITQHQFKQAKHYLEIALAEGGNRAGTHLMMVDVLLETGDEYGAKRYLRQLSNKNSFAYLIREAKVKDHEGKLDTAILLMEKAYQRIQNNKERSSWALSNLGDMYGHAGRIEKAYQNYLTVLRNDPHYDYALKGISNILFSNDHNITEAKRIINILASRKNMPEADLMLAKIAAFEGNVAKEKEHLELFRAEVTQSKYNGMYNVYMAELEAEYFGNPSHSIAIAHQEIKNRPTPRSFDLLAWGFYHSGDYTKALEISQRYVENKTFEPVPLFHLAILYDVNGDHEKAKMIFKSLTESYFELGPAISSIIRQKLS